MINKKPILNPSLREGNFALFFSFQRKKELRLCGLFLILSLACFSQKKYVKEYYANGNMKQEGWLKDNKKVAYWKFYYKNGSLKEEGRFKNGKRIKYWYFYRKNSAIEKEGHYKNGTKHNWWLFYDKDGFVDHKCQLKDNQKNGYCLIYRKQQLVKASKFKEGKKIKEWTDFASFKKENSLLDLR